ncbi:MAG: phage tail tape measure protein [Lachnospiraceae bacterium]|nr:phage tail tape measure protein [Lachnospiraceae bacterium]
MELFKLFGTIAVKNTEANSAIDETTDKAQSFSQKLSEKFTDIGAKATSMGTKMSVGLTAPIMLIGSKAIQTTADFEAAMSEVGAISGATGDDLAALESKARQMGETTKFSASESAEALKYMAMAGWKTEDMLDGLEGVLDLAAASGADLGTTSDIVTDALTAMGYSAGDAGRLADVMAAASSNANTNVELMGETFKYAGTMAGTMGYSMEDAALAIGLMANSGIKGSMAGTSLNAIISRLATNTNGATECINELGVEFYNADGSARNFGDVISELREATKGLTTEQKAEIASTIAGEEAKKGLLAILNASAEDYDKLSTAINSSSGSAKEMADMMNDNLSGQLTLLKSQLEGLAIQFITLILPYLKQGVEWLSKVCEWISGLDDGTKKMIITVAAVLAAAGPILIFVGKIATGIGSVISIGSKLIGGITTLIPVISSISAPVALVIAGIAALVAIGVALYKNWDTIKEKAGELKEKVVSKVTEMKEKAGEKFTQLKEKGEEKINSLRENTVSKLNEMKENASEKISEMKDRVVTGFQNMKEEGAEKFRDLKEKWSSKFTEAREKIVGEAVQLKEKAGEKIGEFKSAAVEKIESFREGAVNKFRAFGVDAKNVLENVCKSGVSGFQGIREKGLEAVGKLKTDAISYFQEMGNTVADKFGKVAENIGKVFGDARDAVSKIVSDIKSFFKFEWKLPDIKLPHFNIKWDSSGMLGKLADTIGLPGLPKLDVDWYKRAMDSPLIMDKPTAFGINRAGQVMAGGEAGSEVVSGTQTLMNMISAAVSENNNQMLELLNRLYELLSSYLPAIASRQLVLDSGALVGELAGPMSEELARDTYMRGRRN